MLLEHVHCDICGSADYKVRYRQPDVWLKRELFEYPVVECRACGLVYVNPRPTPEAMAGFYPPGYHDGRDTQYHLARYERQSAMLPPLDHKRVLDIGCARGDFLAFLLGKYPAAEAHGVDAFSPGVDDPRIRFHRGDLGSAGYDTGSFDVVMAWAVFEHLHAPREYFLESARILKPGGKLVVLVTNADSLYGRIAQSEDVPRHTYHFTRSSLSGYGRLAGLRLHDLRFDDSIFDGRGRGTFRRGFGRMAGFGWVDSVRGEPNTLQRLAMKAGGALDALAFHFHWEAALGMGGIMIATYEKP